MLNEKKNSDKKSKPGKALTSIILIFVGCIFGLALPLIYKKVAGEVKLNFVFWISFGISVLAHIVIHETGHLLFGLMTGYKFSSFRMFSFMLIKEDGKIKLKHLNIAGTGGQCLMSPPEIVNGKIPVVLYNLGGVFANAIISAAAVILCFFCCENSILFQIFLAFSAVGFLSAITNGIPLNSNVNNDGYNTLELLKNDKAKKAFYIQLKVNEQTSKGVRLKDMPDEWFEVPNDEDMKNSLIAACAVYACNRLMDEKNFSQADLLMKHILALDSGIVTIHRNLLVCDRLYIELIGENRREIVEKMCSAEQMKFMRSMKKFPSVIRTDYVLALLFEKDKTKAKKIKDKFDAVSKTYPYPSDIKAESDLMKIAENKA